MMVTGEKLKLIEALNETLKAEFRHNPDTFIWGQDMANKDKGGIFNVIQRDAAGIWRAKGF